MMGVIKDVHAASCYGNEKAGAVFGRILRRDVFMALSATRGEHGRLAQGFQRLQERSAVDAELPALHRTARAAAKAAAKQAGQPEGPSAAAD